MYFEDGNDNLCPLGNMPLGTEGSIVELTVTGLTRRRLLDLGLLPGTKVVPIRRSPFRDPTAYFVRGTMIALRQEDSGQIIVRKSDC
ncbi:MAG: FeoA domain-containing protein [Firmicutes bacterium]|nr:FeoA domain-containing protein [Bacillota bacterium]